MGWRPRAACKIQNVMGIFTPNLAGLILMDLDCFAGATFTNKELHTLTPAWISKYMLSKVPNWIIYSFPNFNRVTDEVWKWISNFPSHFINDVIIYLCWGSLSQCRLRLNMVYEVMSTRHDERNINKEHMPHQIWNKEHTPHEIGNNEYTPYEIFMKGTPPKATTKRARYTRNNI